MPSMEKNKRTLEFEKENVQSINRTMKQNLNGTKNVTYR